MKKDKIITMSNPKRGDSIKEQYLQSGRQCGKTMSKLTNKECDRIVTKLFLHHSLKSSDTAKLTKYSNMILAEYRRAKDLHPLWPDDIIHAVAIMCKESGEAIRSALNMQYEDWNIEDVEKELIQTAAMCLRCLVNLEK